MEDLIKKGYIPLDKSWMIRMGVLDLVNGYDSTINYLKQHYEGLSDDLKALYHACIQWKSGKPIDVGESGTLFRFLKFASWKLNKNKKFIIKGTLKKRKICNNPEIINWSLKKLLKLDNKTSQWASAAVLLGNQEKVENPPYKLQLTYGAVKQWKSAREKAGPLKAKYDKTILKQAKAYLRGEGFVPEQAEDYCFARAFGYMTAKQGEEKWPSLKGHESNRIIEMEKAIKSGVIDSKDHRVVQAIAMLRRDAIKIKYPSCVNKSWPQFWKFLEESDIQ